MATVRKWLSWAFAFTCLVCARITFSLARAAVGQWQLLHAQHNLRGFLFLWPPSQFLMFTVVFGMAWWTVFKGRPSARVWGIAASLINVVIALLPIAIPPHSIRNAFLLILALGVVGLVAFWRKFDPATTNFVRPQPAELPPDGTNDFLNRTAEVLFLALFVGTYHWWKISHQSSGIADAGFWYLTGISTLFGFMLVTLHEMGHTAVGLALGMKLRSFMIGPFQWHLRDGSWRFEFKPREILAGGGKTGIVPGRADFPRWGYLTMIAAGPAANLLTGVLALFIASFAQFGLTEQNRALLDWFGIWSVAICVANLVPFRTRSNYSDGAHIYHFLLNGTWADLHRIFSVGGATLVTPLRPRDYDIERIHRATSRIQRGIYGFVLRIYAYGYFFDRGRFDDAGEVIREAALIYEDCASEVAADTHTVLVVAFSYIHHDATAARQWWTRMEAKKPTENVDYWMAAAALHWIERNLEDANQAWEKANVLAHRLPQAGAYEFDRHCCGLLRRALDEVPTTA